jgi:hypothetical protein
MYATNHISEPSRRQGVILMVVLALLTLFAIIGVSFVYYADAEAKASQLDREAQQQAKITDDVDAQKILNYFIGQLLSDTDSQNGVYSALRGHSLGRSIYGYNDTTGAFNILPFNGPGRLHGTTILGQDDYYLVNYTYFPADGIGLRDPERIGTRLNPQVSPNPNPYFGVNAPYTYSDINNMYLAAVRADGTVLVPSFHRAWAGFGSLDPANPNWLTPSTVSPVLKYQVLRPRPIDQLMVSNGVVVETWPPNRPYFPLPADPGGDVKNLAGAPAWIDPASGKQCNNDSFWMDVGFPVMTDLNGKKFKALVAALIVDLDNRINLNVHGNIRGQNSTHGSNQGWGPWAVNLGQVLNDPNANPPTTTVPEWSSLFAGSSSTGSRLSGRYGPDQQPGTAGSLATTGVAGHFYSPADFDEVNEQGGYAATQALNPIGFSGPGMNSPFPAFPQGYGNSSAAELTNHPSIYSLFPPLVGDDRSFPLSNLEGLLRYGDTGSSNLLSSDLLRMCSKNFTDTTDPTGPNAAARRRRLVTLRSFDIDRPGVVPWIWPSVAGTPPAPPPYQLVAPSLYPVMGAPIPFAAPVNATATQPPTEYGPDWRALSATLGKLDLNRPLPNYPLPAASGLITDTAGFMAAQTARVQLARDIFTVLLATTTATPPSALPGTPPAPGTNPGYDAARWLAQLAVNIVDFIDTDDYMTPFPWNPNNANEVVFGTELPHVVINEAYAEWSAQAVTTNPTPVSVWVELLNTFNTDSTLVPPPGGNPGDAALATSAQSVYQIAICQPDLGSSPAAAPGTTYYRQANNVWGSPYPIPGPGVGMTYPINLMTGSAGGSAGGQLAATDAGASTWLPGAQIIPASNAGPGPNGYYLVGPGQIAGGGPTPQNVIPSMAYQVATAMANQAPPAPTIMLQRLACPYIPFNNTPGPQYNPFVTVDYMQNVNVNATTGRIIGSNTAAAAPDNETTSSKNNLTWRQSDGRLQPYVGYSALTGTLKQLQTSTTAGQPQTTFPDPTTSRPGGNNPVQTPFNWLVHLDRPLSSPMELLHVSALKPHELTQEFVDPAPPAGNGLLQPFNHRVPWFDEDLASAGGTQSHLLYRFFEFAMTRSRASGLAAPFTTSTTRVTNSTPGTPVSAAITPAAMSGVSPSGVPWSIQPGSVLVIQAPDPVSGNWVIQETVVVPPGGVTPTTFTASFFKSYNQASGPQGMNIIVTSTGDRSPGRININTIWDPETLLAFTDPQPSNNFQLTDVYQSPPGTPPTDVYNRLLLSRTPTGSPGAGDQPFWGSATGLYPTGDSQFANPPGTGPGYGLNNTILRSATAGGASNTPRLFETSSGGTTPYARYQLLNKIFNNVTTRSNVFAVWMTVGFFEVIQDTDPVTGQAVRPVKLGAEMNSATNQQKRHRMFAIVDRSALTVPSGSVAGGVSVPFATLAPIAPATSISSGLQAVSISTVSNLAVPVPVGGAGTAVPPTVPTLPWTLQQGSMIVVDAGTPQQETVFLSGVNANTLQVSATFSKTHSAGATVYLYLLPGNPGPQARFDVRDPLYQLVVPYFSIIQ